MRATGVRRLVFGLAAIVAVVVVLGVWVTHQFPGLTATPRSSAEIVRDLFRAPFHIVDPARYVLRGVRREAVILFIQSCELPPDAEDRLARMVRGEEFREVTVPFIYYLWDLYGAPVTGEARSAADLAYDEPPEPAGEGALGLAQIVRNSKPIRKHVRNALRLFDALFLQVKPGQQENPVVEARYEPAAYDDIKAILKEAFHEMFPESAEASRADRSEYIVALEGTLRDDRRFSELVEFIADFIRELSGNWMESYARSQARKEQRLAWIQDAMARNRYCDVADFARARAERKLVVHITVDGLQGKLLEGLAALSRGDRESPGARYVIDLVRQHQAPTMDASRYEPRMPPALGRDIVELAGNASDRPDYLRNFKRLAFSPAAQAVIVHVATVDTPTISMRNMPIISTGHGAAGPFGTGVPNFSYLDRRTGRGWYFWGSDVLQFRRVFSNREDLIFGGQKRSEGPGARTLFERLWRLNSVSCMAHVDTGATETVSQEVGVAVGELKRNFIEKVILLRLRARARMEEELNRRRKWLMEHRRLSHGFLASLVFQSAELKTFHDFANYLAEHDDEGLPDYLFWYNPWPDHFGHGKGPYSDAIIGYRGEYDRIDFYLGKLAEVYESVKAVDGHTPYAGRTLFGISSDHGLVYTPWVISTDEVLFDAMRREGIQVTYQKLTHDEGGMPAIHGRRDLKPTRPFDAVVGSTAGGSYIIDLFDSRGLQGDEVAWRRHPDYHELREHRLLSGQTIDWIGRIREHLKDVLDFAIVREYGPRIGTPWPPEVQSVVRIVTPDRGEARIIRIRPPGSTSPAGTRYRYEVLGEQDPLDLVGSVRDFLLPPGGPTASQVQDSLKQCIQSRDGVEDRIWRELLSCTLRADSIYQLSHLYDSDRAGTVNIFPAHHVGMNSGVPGRHAGEAFGEKNGILIAWGAGLQRATLQTARTGSLAVTLYHWIAGDEAFSAVEPEFGASPADQFGYPSLLSDPVFAPIR